jgi:UDP-2-acetamido-3-amino-2,3-dideoxy-glucuronate N-acetyltransferase
MSSNPDVHPTAVVDEGAQIGSMTKIWHFCHIMADSLIGRDCVLGQNVFIASKVKLGDRIHVQNNVSIYEGVILEDDVFVGPSVVFTNVHHPRVGFPRKDQYLTTIIRRGATLGANCTVICGNEIGAYAMVAAGSVVTRDVPPFALVAGVPARRTGWVCRCGTPLPDAAGGACPECDRRYHMCKGALEEISVSDSRGSPAQ